MIPIKNRKKNLEATVEEMRNFSFSYVELTIERVKNKFPERKGCCLKF